MTERRALKKVRETVKKMKIKEWGEIKDGQLRTRKRKGQKRDKARQNEK